MPSHSLNTWLTARSVALDQIEDAHRSVGGTGRGRRYTTHHLNQAYTVLLVAQSQGFCRDLHDECIECLVAGITPVRRRDIVDEALSLNRKLDTGNPNPGNIGSDFGRFGLKFWDEVRLQDARNESRQAHLEDLHDWRNAIAHQNFDPAVLGSTALRLELVRIWRQACHHLATSFDEVMRRYIHSLMGTWPW
jgi:hypothetical protein